MTGADVAIVDWPGQALVDLQVVPVDSDGNWSSTLTVDPDVRNGAYWIIALCERDGTDQPIYAAYDPVKYRVRSPQGQPNPALRIAGVDRIATAIAASRDVFVDSESADAVVLTRSDSYADALAGTPLASDQGGPLLLTGGDTLDSRTEAEIKRVLSAGTTVFVLGGSAAVSDNVTGALQRDGFVVDRVAGPNRFATAVAVAEVIGQPSSIVLANGMDFRDGLVGGAAAASGDPVGALLLTDGSRMPPETSAYLQSHPPGVPPAAVGEPAAAADPSAYPLVGADDAETSVKVAHWFFDHDVPYAVGVATDASFADGLAGGAHAVAFGGPLLLTRPNQLPDSVVNYLHGPPGTEVIAYVYGGTAAISDDVVRELIDAISTHQ